MKKIILISSGIIILIVLVLVILLNNKSNYEIRVSMVDDQSPDRILTVYNNNKKIEVDQIEYSDGTLLCKGYNTTVHFGDIENEKVLIIVLKDKSKIEAKIVKDEVK